MSGHTPQLRAYYYSFTTTGNADIDDILEAVAAAGKAYHHTEDWSEENHDGIPYAEAIQLAADAAASVRLETAADLERAKADIAGLVEALTRIKGMPVGGPHVSATDAFSSALAIIDRIRDIANAALAKHARAETSHGD